jgi:transposase
VHGARAAQPQHTLLGLGRRFEALHTLVGVGTDTAAALLVAAGDNPERLRSEGAFARLCGVAPLPSHLDGLDIP